MKRYILKFLGAPVCVISVCLALAGCGGQQGIFAAIEQETELRDATVAGNIFSILEFNTALYAGGGSVYRKVSSAGWEDLGSPYGIVARLAAGYSGGSEYLYAFCASYGTYRLYGRKAGNAPGEFDDDWIEITMPSGSGSLRTIFSNNAVSTGGAASGNRAFVTTSEGIYELTGTNTSASSPSNGAAKENLAAAYAGGQTYFSASAAFASDGTNLFGPATVTIGSETVVAVDGAVSLWADSGNQKLYIGKNTGADQATIGAGGTLTGEAIDGSNASATIALYRITAIYATGGTVYAATMGHGTTYASKKNGLWAYRGDKWDRE
jgi:hypothetical protein